MRRRRDVVAPLFLLVFVTVACTGSGGEDAPGDAAMQAERAIGGAEERGPETTELAIDRLAVTSPDELRTAALAHIESEAPQIHVAALYALALSVNHDTRDAIEALRGLLDQGPDAERLTAAGGLLSAGEKAAIPILIDLLASRAPVPYSDPPRAVWEVARGVLLSSTDQDLGLGEATGAEPAASVQADWQTWFSG